MKIIASNVQFTSSVELILPCTERDIKTACELLNTKNDMTGRVVIQKIDKREFEQLRGNDYNLDELNFLSKELEFMEKVDQNNYYYVVEENKVEDIKDLINLTYYITDDVYEEIPNVYNGRTLPTSLYDSLKMIVEVKSLENNEVDALYFPCEQYELEKAKMRLGCTDESKLQYSIVKSDFGMETEKIIESVNTFENLNEFANAYSFEYNCEYDFRKVEMIVEALKIKTVEELEYVLDDQIDFYVYENVSSDEEFARTLGKEAKEDLHGPDIIDFVDFKKFGEFIVEEKMVLVSENHQAYVEYIGDSNQMIDLITQKQTENNLSEVSIRNKEYDTDDFWEGCKTMLIMASISNREQDKTHGVFFPCSEAEIDKMCNLLEIENNLWGNMILNSTDNPSLSGLNGSICNFDEMNLFVKELLNNSESEQEEFYKLAKEHKLDNIKDMINLLYNPETFIKHGHEVYDGTTLPPTYYKEPKIIVEMLNTETLESEFLYMPCEDYVVEKAKARLGCFNENKISYEIYESFYSESVRDIITQEKTLENYDYFTRKAHGLSYQDSFIIDEMVEELKITTFEDLKTLMGEYKKFSINQEIYNEFDLGKFYMSETPNQTKVLENEDMYSYGEQIAQQEKGMFFQGNYVIYMGKNEDIQEIIDNHFQKEPVMSM